MRHTIEPRGLTLEDALYYIGVSTSWFSKNRKELVERLKFPRPHPVTNKYDRKQLDTWWDETGGIEGVKSQLDADEEELIARARSGQY